METKTPLRPPEQVMKLSRLGAFHQTRISFVRSLLRKVMAENYSFGVWALVALVVGNAVGAGIYTTSGFALADLGSREWVLLAWLVAGVIALMGALSYGMLVQGMNQSGGEYLYLTRSIHPLAGFVAAPVTEAPAFAVAGCLPRGGGDRFGGGRRRRRRPQRRQRR